MKGDCKMKNIMKISLAVFGIFLLTSSAIAQQSTPMLDQGTRELSLSGRIELPDFEKVDYDIDASYGYFVRDGWELGVQVGASDFGSIDRIDVTGFTEYNFNRNSNWVPYIGAALGLAAVNFDDGINASTDLNDGDGWVFDVETGIKWFVRHYMAITTSIEFKFATDDIFATDNEIEDNLTSLRIGMRFYF
jgi:hypothetical protein